MTTRLLRRGTAGASAASLPAGDQQEYWRKLQAAVRDRSGVGVGSGSRSEFEMTVKVHRSQVMRKMRAKSLVDLVRMADRLAVSTRKS